MPIDLHISTAPAVEPAMIDLRLLGCNINFMISFTAQELIVERCRVLRSQDYITFGF